MKNIAVAVIILALGIVAFVQYRKLKGLNPPESYEYAFRDDIDLNYHNPKALRDYYESGYMAGSFAREMWKNRCIDVRHPESDDSSNRIAVTRYNRLMSYADSLGARMARSQILKTQGFNDAEIISIETGSSTAADLNLMRTFGYQILQKGDKNAGVLRMQEWLLKEGYVIPTDGYFWVETEAAVSEFQKKNGIFSSGIATWETLNSLMKKHVSQPR